MYKSGQSQCPNILVLWEMTSTGLKVCFISGVIFQLILYRYSAGVLVLGLSYELFNCFLRTHTLWGVSCIILRSICEFLWSLLLSHTYCPEGHQQTPIWYMICRTQYNILFWSFHSLPNELNLDSFLQINVWLNGTLCCHCYENATVPDVLICSNKGLIL